MKTGNFGGEEGWYNDLSKYPKIENLNDGGLKRSKDLTKQGKNLYFKNEKDYLELCEYQVMQNFIK